MSFHGVGAFLLSHFETVVSTFARAWDYFPRVYLFTLPYSYVPVVYSYSAVLFWAFFRGRTAENPPVS